jgi:malate synthase
MPTAKAPKKRARARSSKRAAKSSASPKRAKAAAAKSKRAGGKKAAARTDKPSAKSGKRAPRAAKSGRSSTRAAAKSSGVATPRARGASTGRRKLSAKPVVAAAGAKPVRPRTARSSPSGTPAPASGRALRSARRPERSLERVRSRIAPAKGVAVLGTPVARDGEVLTPGALDFLGRLHRRIEARRRMLLAEASDPKPLRPGARQETADGAKLVPTFADRGERRVQIAAPGDRSMLLEPHGSDADVCLADFDDQWSPTWESRIEGQINLRDRWLETRAADPASGRETRLDPPAALVVRPRGWRHAERHLTVDGEPIAAALFDFGLYLFHNAGALREHGSGPCFCLPVPETAGEARLWNEVFVFAQEQLGLPAGTVKATVLVETPPPAGSDLDAILSELRDHICEFDTVRAADLPL